MFFELERFSLDRIMDMEQRYRATLLNIVSGFKAANLIATRNAEGLTNVAIFNSVVHIGANPPYLGFILRPLEAARHTYDNIQATGQFTINLVSTEMIKVAHQTSAKYPEGVSEFEACGLTPQYTTQHKAPYVMESPLKLGLHFEEEHLIKANDTRLIVGKVVEMLLPPVLIQEDGFLDLQKLSGVSVAGLDAYYTPVFTKRMPYARAPKP